MSRGNRGFPGSSQFFFDKLPAHGRGFTHPPAGHYFRFFARFANASTESLFDGKTLNGWQLIENNAYSLVTASIKDPPAFTTWMINGTDPMSEYLRAHLQDSVKSGITDWSATVPDAQTKLSALTRDINRIIGGPSLYDKDRFNGIFLRRETAELVARHPATQLDIAKLNKLLIEDAYPDDLTPTIATPGWIVKEGAMTSTGSGRGVIYTDKDYARFKLSLTMRHVSGDPDHQACILIFCARPKPDEMPQDALAGIQFQVPNGGHWDYRPDKNNAGNAEFTTIAKTKFDPHAWARIEITADATTGTATMTTAQPPEAKPVEVVTFKDPTAGKSGPIALQMHNAGLFDEYIDLSIENVI